MSPPRASPPSPPTNPAAPAPPAEPGTPSTTPSSWAPPNNLKDAYQELGTPPELRPGHVVHRHKGHVMFNLATIDSEFRVHPMGIWISGSDVRVLTLDGQLRLNKGPGETYGLTGGGLTLIDGLIHVARGCLARIEEVDLAVAGFEKDALHVNPLDIVRSKRRVAIVRAELSRAITALAELEGGGFDRALPGIAAALPTVEQELLHLRELTQATQSSLSDLLAIRQVDQGNHLQVMANQLQVTSNRISELANVSNVRMLGLAYMALVLALVATINIFPNTAATIFGMPSAGYVNGWIVTGVLLIVTIIPLAWLFSRKWIRDAINAMSTYEARIDEGMRGLVERVPEPQGFDRPYKDPPGL